MVLAFIALVGADAVPVPANPFLHTPDADGAVVFELSERTHHPHFWWPRTLLNYRVLFPHRPEALAEYRLVDLSAGQTVPFQLSEERVIAGGQWAATVSFFSDLPTGGLRTYRFQRGAPGLLETPLTERIRISEEPASLVLDTGPMKVRVPKSRPQVAAGSPVAGPIEAVADAQGWMGRSQLIGGHQAPTSITTTITDQGPLFGRVRVTYAFANGSRYETTIRAAAGCDFVEVGEQITGLRREDETSFEIEWTDVDFDHRRGNEPIAGPKTLFFRGEDPAFTGPARIENPAEEFYFRLAHTAADNTINLTAVDFTDGKHARTVGLAVGDGGRWDDGEYAIWASSDALAIRFRYAGGRLHWRWPLVAGTRDMILAAYDPERAGHSSGAAFTRWQKEASPMAEANTGVSQAKSYIAFLNSRQGGMSLDVVKEWPLAYPSTARRPGADIGLPNSGAKPMESPEAYLHALWSDTELVRPEGNWLSPVSLRVMSQWVVPGYLRWREKMSDTDRRRVEALLLFHACFAAREEVSPMRHVLKGHPNFVADWKYPLLAGAFLFPDHPLAHEWADQFEKVLELMGVFYVRPSVSTWDARGGRWTENIGVYNWAFIEPAVHANELGLRFDGRDRWPSAGMALHGEYLAGILTAPVKLGSHGVPLDVKPGTPLVTANGFQRIYPPQGAHSGRRAIPAVIEDFGESLRRYRPLVGEHLLWASQRPVGGATNADGIPLVGRKEPTNAGTNPRLTSAKYTGYGIVLRAAVDTPEEISVFLQQIDKGPNYRWGFGNEGGCGDIYYYAGGKSYAGHLMEDAGDRRVTDAETSANTGVYRDATFRGIGMNELTEPFFDLEAAQFAELLPRRGPDAYSWPEYGGRSVMLVGHDYIITFDVVNTVSRMSWNTVEGQDELPTLIPIRGETAFRTTQTSTSPRLGTSNAERLEPYKTGGDRMVLISHRKTVKVLPTPKAEGEGVAMIETPESSDLVFEQRDAFTASARGVVFAGRAGVARRFSAGRTELVLFHGTKIGTDDLVIEVSDPDVGISAVFTQPRESAGVISSRAGARLTLTPRGGPGTSRFFLDGAEIDARRVDRSLVMELPAGRHRWELTGGFPEPMAPEILRSEALRDGARLFIAPVSGADRYRVERSDDNGITWTPIGESSGPEFAVTGCAVPSKLHVRAIAENHGRRSRAGRDYPLYVTGRPPDAPAGLRLMLGKDSVAASWGEILGAKEYVLLRRQRGAAEWREVYRGLATHFSDRVDGVLPAYSEPGLEACADRLEPTPRLYEYAVRAVDGVGDGSLSNIADTDPASWRNWYPPVPLVFKRRSTYWLPPYVRPEQVPPATYPE